MMGRTGKRPPVHVLRQLHADAVRQVPLDTVVARSGACLKTLRQWWRDAGFDAPLVVRQRHRQAIMAEVFRRHPDARRGEAVAAVRRHYPETTPRTVYIEQVRLGIPTQHERRLAEVERLLSLSPSASRASIHATMRTSGWSAGLDIVGKLIREIRGRREVRSKPEQTAEHALVVNDRHALLRRLLDERPDARDEELAKAMAEAGHACAVNTVGEDRRCLGIPAVYARRAAEVEAYVANWPDLSAECVHASMKNDGWTLSLRATERLVEKARAKAAA